MIQANDNLPNNVIAITHLSPELGGHLGVAFKVHEDVIGFLLAVYLICKLALVPLTGGTY